MSSSVQQRSTPKVSWQLPWDSALLDLCQELCQTVAVKMDQHMSIIPSCIYITGHILKFLQCKLLRINRL